MSETSRRWRRLRVRILESLAIPLLLPLGGASLAGDVLPVKAPAAVAEESRPLGLLECIQVALERQPAIDAQRASLAAAETGRRALAKMRVLSLVSRELPIRRQQAEMGVTVASAALDQTERETTYAVTRLYYSVIYAKEQKRVTDDVVDHLKATLETAKNLVKAGHREVTTSTVDKITVYLRLAETKQTDAARGMDRALAALREAMGLEPGCPLQIAGDKLPEVPGSVSKDNIVDLAIARRNEIVQAITLAEVNNLEVKAQGTKYLQVKAPTFAAGSDIHARPIPQGSSDGEYRPGAVGPETPTMLVGCRGLRMERARDFHARSAAVVDKTRMLIALEAEDAYLKWEEASRKVPLTREAADKAAKLADDTRKDFGGEQKVKAEDVLTNEMLAAQARASHNEARHQLALALAALERVTAGGFSAGLTNK